MKAFILIVVLTASLSVLAAGKKGKVMYRYKNEAGTTVLDSSIPPQYVKKGYQVVSSYGKVIDTIAPALTKEQAQKLEHAKKQDQTDKVLLRMYSGAHDAQRAFESKTAAIDLKIAYLKSNINQLRGKLENELTRAANTERRGREVSPETLGAIKSQRSKVQSSEQSILDHKKEKEVIKNEFDQIIARLQVLKPSNKALTSQ